MSTPSPCCEAMPLEIVEYPNPLLKEKSQPVDSVTTETRQLISDMFETMYAAQGVGLASVQVGILEQILVIDVGKLENEETKPNPIALINPTIETSEGTLVWEEGCLSVPELIAPIERSANVIVRALNQDGKEVKILGEQLLAVALQHEIDHLNGILLVDHLSRLKRDLYRKRLAKRETIEIPEPSSVKPYLG